MLIPVFSKLLLFLTFKKKLESGAIRIKGLKSRFLVQLLYFGCNASVAHRSTPLQIFQRVQFAIDFVALRKRSWSSGANGGANVARSLASPNLHLTPNF